MSYEGIVSVFWAKIGLINALSGAIKLYLSQTEDECAATLPLSAQLKIWADKMQVLGLRVKNSDTTLSVYLPSRGWVTLKSCTCLKHVSQITTMAYIETNFTQNGYIKLRSQLFHYSPTYLLEHKYIV